MMRSLIVSSVALLAVVLAMTPAWTQADDKAPTFAEQFTAQLDEWLPGMGAEKIENRRDSQQKLQDLIFSLGGPGHENDLKTACSIIASRLGPDTAGPARIWLLHVLEFNGGPECVDAVAACLEDPDATIRDCARRSLANNPAPEANQKLLDALATARDAGAKAALANSLGYRADAKSVPALNKLLADGSTEVVAAAANALGQIADADAARALKTAAAQARPPLLQAIVDAYFRCADKLLAEGKAAEAKSMYAEWIGADKPKAIRMAAMTGMLKAAGKQ